MDGDSWTARGFEGGCDDHYTLVFHGDNRETIKKNEQMDNCFYVKDDIGHEAPIFQKLLGGCPSGLVNFSAIERRKQGAIGRANNEKTSINSGRNVKNEK